MSKVTHLEFNKDFRIFKAGQRFDFDPYLNVIIGDNGSGKSSLIGCIRELFPKTRWTVSEISIDKGVLSNQPFEGEECQYIDLSSDLLREQHTHFDSKYSSLQIKCMDKSSGQAAFLQLGVQLEDHTSEVVIIDEPERGLSQAKQMVLAYLIKKNIESHPERQFFVITHSYELMQALETLRPLRLMPTFEETTTEKYQALSFVYGMSLIEKMKI